MQVLKLKIKYPLLSINLAICSSTQSNHQSNIKPSERIGH
jgi:hypothetical protein